MKTFLIVESQSGGCDYTIGCGTLTWMMEAESMEACLAELKRKNDYLRDEGACDSLNWLIGEQERSHVVVYEIAAQADVPLGEWTAELNVKRARKAHDADLNEFLRLKKKLGK